MLPGSLLLRTAQRAFSELLFHELPRRLGSLQPTMPSRTRPIDRCQPQARAKVQGAPARPAAVLYPGTAFGHSCLGKLLYFRQMASITLSLPDDLASQIRVQQEQLPRILEMGLRELNAAGQSGFDGAADVLELLAALPTPEEILNLRPSSRLSARVAEMVEKSRLGEMTPGDEQDWERYEYLEHLVRMAKAAARLKLASSAGDG